MAEYASDAVMSALAPARRVLGWARIAGWGQRGLAAGALAGFALLLIAHLFPFERATTLSIVCAGLGAVIGAGAGLFHWPTPQEAARQADGKLDLADRLTTALEFRDSSAPIPALQRVDTLRRVGGRNLRAAGWSGIKGRESALAASSLLCLGMLLYFGGSPHAASASRVPADDRSHIVTAARGGVEGVIRAAQRGLPASSRSDPAMKQLASQLTALRAQLLRTGNRAAALRSISVAQSRLNRLAARLHAVDAASLAQLQRALQGYTGHYQPAPAHEPAAATARTLSSLGTKLSHMTAAQRSSLARNLERSANALGDRALRQDLRRAASSLAANDPQLARSGLKQASRLVANTPRNRADQARLRAAARQLDAVKNTVSGLHNRNTPTNRAGGPGSRSRAAGNQNGRPGTGTASRAQSRGGILGSKRGQGTTSKQGGGQSSARRGAGNSTGNGLATSLARRNGQGGVNSVSRRRGGTRGKGRGRYALVYVPGQQGKGPHTVRNVGSSPPSHGRVVPYQEVIVQYGQAARTALTRTNLPPSLRAYVRRYFVALSQ